MENSVPEMSGTYFILIVLKTDLIVYAKYDMDISLFIFRNILCSYFLSANYSHRLIKKKTFFFFFLHDSSRSLCVTHMGFLMKYFKAAFSEQFYCFYY